MQTMTTMTIRLLVGSTSEESIEVVNNRGVLVARRHASVVYYQRNRWPEVFPAALVEDLELQLTGKKPLYLNGDIFDRGRFGEWRELSYGAAVQAGSFYAKALVALGVAPELVVAERVEASCKCAITQLWNVGHDQGCPEWRPR